jgi:hypothetical protein
VLLGTPWELENALETCWEHIGNKGKKSKITPPTPPPTSPLKGKIKAGHECMLSLPISCMKYLFPKLFVTIFGLG